MVFLQTMAAIAQIIGVCWAILFGSKAIYEVFKDIKVNKHLRFPTSGTIINILLSAILLTLISLSLRSSPTFLPGAFHFFALSRSRGSPADGYPQGAPLLGVNLSP